LRFFEYDPGTGVIAQIRFQLNDLQVDYRQDVAQAAGQIEQPQTVNLPKV
jgi:hypothetical protein